MSAGSLRFAQRPWPSGLRDLSAKLVEAVPDRRVEDEVTDAQHDPAEDLGIDVAAQLDLIAGLLADPLADAAIVACASGTALVIWTGSSWLISSHSA